MNKGMTGVCVCVCVFCDDMDCEAVCVCVTVLCFSAVLCCSVLCYLSAVRLLFFCSKTTYQSVSGVCCVLFWCCFGVVLVHVKGDTILVCVCYCFVLLHKHAFQ